MPIHVVNELIFNNADAATQARVLAAACGRDGKVDFEVLLPLPLNMWWGNVGSNHEKTFKRTALDWCVEHWGTKWNAYDHKPIEQTQDTLTLRFETAWSPPYPWLAAIFNGCKVSFDHNWLDEGAERGVHGIFDFTQVDRITGQPWREEPASDDLHRHLHKLHWGVEQFDEEAQ
jgi:hypothetical protein